jgi:hypothetical protein
VAVRRADIVAGMSPVLATVISCPTKSPGSRPAQAEVGIAAVEPAAPLPNLMVTPRVPEVIDASAMSAEPFQRA